MMTPKGCSFLYVKKELQSLFDPLLISWGYESAAPSSSRFQDYHQGQGTRDFSAFLTVPASIAFLKEHQWELVAAACRKLVQQNAMRFCDLVEAEPISPISDEFLGQMFSIPIRTPQPEKLQRHLFDHYSIEVPVTRQDNRNFIRYSINAFNSQEDLDKLYAALQEIISDTALLECSQKVAR
jgi:isopenicillin-N epimerase